LTNINSRNIIIYVKEYPKSKAFVKMLRKAMGPMRAARLPDLLLEF
jgi:hypothetical protein